MADYLTVDRRNKKSKGKLIEEALDCLKRRNISIMLFPEGTRSADGQIGFFKRVHSSLQFRQKNLYYPL